MRKFKNIYHKILFVLIKRKIKILTSNINIKILKKYCYNNINYFIKIY